MSRSPWSRLHDATLLSVALAWESGEVGLELRTATAPRARISGRGARLLECPRRLPWGPSASINEVRGPFPTADGEAHRLELELQSGDTLALEAEQFELIETG